MPVQYRKRRPTLAAKGHLHSTSFMTTHLPSEGADSAESALSAPSCGEPDLGGICQSAQQLHGTLPPTLAMCLENNIVCCILGLGTWSVLCCLS